MVQVTIDNLRPEPGYVCQSTDCTMYMVDVTVTTEQGTVSAPLYEYGFYRVNGTWAWELGGNSAYYNDGDSELIDSIGPLFLDVDSEYYPGMSCDDIGDVVDRAYRLMLAMSPIKGA